MLDKEDVKAEYRFAETASDQELARRAIGLSRLVGTLPSGSEARRDARFCLRIAEEELAARADVMRARASYAKRHR